MALLAACASVYDIQQQSTLASPMLQPVPTVLGYAAKPGLLKRTAVRFPDRSTRYLSVPVWFVLRIITCGGRKEGRKEGTNDDL